MVETDWAIPSKQVEGSPVYGRSGGRLGTIDHLMFDKASGRYYASPSHLCSIIKSPVS